MAGKETPAQPSAAAGTKNTRTSGGATSKSTASKGATGKKPAAVKAPAVSTNALAIPWPVDPHGMLSDLKRGAIKAAKRVQGNQERLEKLLDALKLIEGHARARFEQDVAAREAARAEAVSARARAAEKQAQAAEAKAQEFEAAAARVRKAAGIAAEAPSTAAPSGG